MSMEQAKLWRQEAFKMRKRNRANIFKALLYRLGKLWRSVSQSLSKLFAPARSPSKRSRRSQNIEAELYEQASPSHLSNKAIAVPRPSPFLLGLDDLADLEFLTTKDFLQQIEWNAESQEDLLVNEEDMTLLEDLLVNFPES
jgi:hypothetical protein